MSQKIDELNVSPYWKKAFKAFEKAGPLTGLYYENAAELERAERKLVGFNFSAFIFGVFFYFQKGMFEKGMMILGMGWFHGAILLIIAKIMGGGMHPGAFWLPIAAIAGVFGSYDYYRHMVHGDRLWESFKTFENPLKLYGFVAAGLAAILIVAII